MGWKEFSTNRLLLKRNLGFIPLKQSETQKINCNVYNSCWFSVVCADISAMFSCNVHVCERPLSRPPSHRGIHIMRGEASWTQVFRIKLIIPKGSPPPAPPCLHPSLFHHLHLHIPTDFIFSNLAVFSAPPSPQCCSSTSSYFPLPHPHYPFPSLPPLHLHPVTSTVTSPCFLHLLCLILLHCLVFLLYTFLRSRHTLNHFLHRSTSSSSFSLCAFTQHTHLCWASRWVKWGSGVLVYIVTFLTCSSSVAGQTKTDKGVDLIDAGSSILAWIRLAVINVWRERKGWRKSEGGEPD